MLLTDFCIACMCLTCQSVLMFHATWHEIFQSLINWEDFSRLLVKYHPHRNVLLAILLACPKLAHINRGILLARNERNCYLEGLVGMNNATCRYR